MSGRTPAEVLQSVRETEWPAGTLGRLTEEQQTIYFELKVYPHEWPDARLEEHERQILEMEHSMAKAAHDIRQGKKSPWGETP